MQQLKLFVFVFLLSINLPVLAAEAFGEAVLNGFDPELKRQEQQTLFNTLMAEKLPVIKPGISVKLSAQDRADIGVQPVAKGIIPIPEEPRYRVGVVKNVSGRIDFSGFGPNSLPSKPAPFAKGLLKRHDDGGIIWTASIESTEAAALRLQFKNFDLPEGAEVFVFNEYGDAFGPYTQRGPDDDGEFWSDTVSGDTVYVQLRFVGPVTKQDLNAIHFVITGVGHMGPRYQIGSWPGACPGSNASCIRSNILNINCSSATGEDKKKCDIASAMAHYQFISGPFIYICSGGLINDSDTSTQRPFFLTANHCISRAKDAKNAEFYFNYKQCNVSSPKVSGADVRATNRTGDYTLLELKGPPPSGTSLLGWSDTAIANTNGTGLERISHPAGDPQTYSKHSVDTSKPTCSSWPRGSWIYSKDTIGATEGGSSGSPVVNSSLKIVGQLSGACGFNINNVCDSTNNATVDGAFAGYYSEVATWLGSGSGCTASEITEISCSDGIDNDCDGLIDSADSDCSGGPICDLLPSGASCDTNDQCCSNNCKGPPNRKTCK